MGNSLIGKPHKAVLLTFLLCSFLGLVQVAVCQRYDRAILDTDFGEITIDLFSNQAPVTVANFLEYVAKDAYASSHFFRVCTTANEADREFPIEVIQGGEVPDSLLRAPIQLETTEKTGILHKDGTLSMARSEPNSAQTSFFICIGDQPELDFGGKRNPDGQGFAAFGKVIRGMDVVRQIQQLPDRDQYLLDPVAIRSIQFSN
ncbi:peptidylprolyl isomerase [Cyclobacterium xiamenense]|uniref:peptidylprolyl isomerase n=1 Tax=Cyclobacterium xiamenense TaxID=1297121 RepID=UPI0035D06E78